MYHASCMYTYMHTIDIQMLCIWQFRPDYKCLACCRGSGCPMFLFRSVSNTGQPTQYTAIVSSQSEGYSVANGFIWLLCGKPLGFWGTCMHVDNMSLVGERSKWGVGEEKRKGETREEMRRQPHILRPHHFLWDSAEKRAQSHMSSPGWASPGMEDEASSPLQ